MNARICTSIAVFGLAAACSHSTSLVDHDAAVGGDAAALDAALPPDGPECPPYQHMCNGTCIPTSTDPANCGGCGVTCGPGQVCSASGCTDSCLGGLTACDGRCVDLKSDDANCNSCGSPCGQGTGCVDGTCVADVQVGPDPAMCSGGGPAIVVNGGNGAKCLDAVAGTFRWAVCSCRDVDLHNPLFTDAYDSTSGPYMPGQLGGGVGLDGSFTNSSVSTIGGALWASSTVGGVNTSNMTAIAQELHVGGPLTVGNPFTVGADTYVVGDVSTSSTIDIAGKLFLGPGSTVTGNVTYMMPALAGPSAVDPPCDCDPSTEVPVAGFIAAMRPPNNDDAAIGLAPDALANLNSPARLDLPCGRYYLTGIATNSPLVIAAHGRTALFIDGSVITGSPLTFMVTPDGELDVFIANQLSSSAKLSIGSANYPALTRIYIGGVGDSLTLTNDVSVGGFVYLARGRFNDSNPIEMFGGIIAGDFRNTGSTTIHYDRQILDQGVACPVPPAQCNSCSDCNGQACDAGQCGACTTSADCCSPLACENGQCVLVIQ